MSTLLDANRITSLCRAARNGLLIEVVAETASTNTDLRQRLEHLSGPVLRVAERQSAGRGRAGRSWRAAPGDSLCFSLAWPCTRGVGRLTGLPLAVGVAIAAALRTHDYPVMLKWPNDLLLGGAKLGGVVVETSTGRRDAQSPLWVVIGVGLNTHPNHERDNDLPHPVAALAQRVDRDALLALLADALVDMLAQFDREGLGPFIDRWQQWDAYAGHSVMVTDQDTLLHEGIARGIDASGCLQLATADGVIAVAAGDVSLRVRLNGEA
ncbi:MAG: biotin--[acetyl-CoA-carboxylase] ligase [Betaproteobacteria bacterium]|nr:biotin--[acetyl-CoA-carboxylase] ligase [Betaproteobacteria bacterium]